MKIEFYKALWGMAGTLDDQVSRIMHAGFAGIESGVPAGYDRDFAARLTDAGLKWIGMLFVDDADALARGIDVAADMGAVSVTVHSGHDYWDFKTGAAFYSRAVDVQANAPFSVNHETHRARTFFHPAITARYLDEFPELTLCADFSHFTVVCSSLLGDQPDAVRKCLAATRHIHARVGHQEGPQVNDPRAPEWAGHVEQFSQWWDEVVTQRSAAGDAVLTVDPEFGPPHYMPTLPFTRQPVADLWEICVWMKDHLTARWA
ncbi:MAG: sugar phosphate isomerase/epimerase family protein [Fimbriimonadaceae bacterium]